MMMKEEETKGRNNDDDVGQRQQQERQIRNEKEEEENDDADSTTTSSTRSEIAIVDVSTIATGDNNKMEEEEEEAGNTQDDNEPPTREEEEQKETEEEEEVSPPVITAASASDAVSYVDNDNDNDQLYPEDIHHDDEVSSPAKTINNTVFVASSSDSEAVVSAVDDKVDDHDDHEQPEPVVVKGPHEEKNQDHDLQQQQLPIQLSTSSSSSSYDEKSSDPSSSIKENNEGEKSGDSMISSSQLSPLSSSSPPTKKQSGSVNNKIALLEKEEDDPTPAWEEEEEEGNKSSSCLACETQASSSVDFGNNQDEEEEEEVSPSPMLSSNEIKIRTDDNHDDDDDDDVGPTAAHISSPPRINRNEEWEEGTSTNIMNRNEEWDEVEESSSLPPSTINESILSSSKPHHNQSSPPPSKSTTGEESAALTKNAVVVGNDTSTIAAASSTTMNRSEGWEEEESSSSSPLTANESVVPTPTASKQHTSQEERTPSKSTSKLATNADAAPSCTTMNRNEGWEEDSSSNINESVPTTPNKEQSSIRTSNSRTPRTRTSRRRSPRNSNNSRSVSPYRPTSLRNHNGTRQTRSLDDAELNESSSSSPPRSATLSSSNNNMMQSKLAAAGMTTISPAALTTNATSTEETSTNSNTSLDEGVPTELANTSNGTTTARTEFTSVARSCSKTSSISSGSISSAASAPGATASASASAADTTRRIPSRMMPSSYAVSRTSKSSSTSTTANSSMGGGQLTLASGSGDVTSVRSVSTNVSSSSPRTPSSPGAVYVPAPAAFRNTSAVSDAGSWSWDSSRHITEITESVSSSNNNNEDESAPSLSNTNNSGGVIRSGGDSSSAVIDDDPDSKTESLEGCTAARPSIVTDQSTLFEAIPINEEDEDAEPPDVEAIVEERIRQREAELEVAEATEIEQSESILFEVKRTNLYKWIILGVLAAVVVIILAVAFGVKGGEAEDSDQQQEQPTETIIASGPILEEVKERGFLRCGSNEFATGFAFHDTTTGNVDGLCIDICRAIAMAVLGDSEKYEIIFTSPRDFFHKLRDREIDVLTYTTTLTMGRDVLDVNAEVGMSFSVPYHYTGMAFAGVPSYVDCADKLDAFSGPCRGLRICVGEGSTHEIILDDIFPGPEIVLVKGKGEFAKKLENGNCNVVVKDSILLPESSLRRLNYTGPYGIGSNLFSKEPLAIATLDGDPEWSQMTNIVVDVLYSAEKLNITKDTATQKLADLEAELDDEFASFFVDIISTIGNMEEVYRRHLEVAFPRQGMNLLNDGSEGLIYSFPWGHFENSGEILAGGVIESILDREQLRCGVSQRKGFAEFDIDSSMWFGMDIEYCVAVSAALFSAQEARSHVTFVELPVNNGTYRLDALNRGDIDILAGERKTLQSMWQDPQTKTGYSFSPPYFHDNESSDSFALATIHHEDSQFSDFVFWVVMSTFHAEENSISHESSLDMPVVSLFGERLKQMFLDTIWEVGNYGDIYNRTIESTYPRSGRNMINFGTNPQQLALPLS